MNEKSGHPLFPPLLNCTLDERSNGYDHVLEVGSTIDCFTGELSVPRPEERDKLHLKSIPHSVYNTSTVRIKDAEDIAVAIASCCRVSSGELPKFSASCATFLRKSFESHRERKWFLWTCDFQRRIETLLGNPVVKQGHHTHYVHRVYKGGQVFFMRTSSTTRDVEEIFMGYDANLKVEVDGAMAGADVGHNAEYKKTVSRSVEKDVIVGASTVCDFFANNEEDVQKMLRKLKDVKGLTLLPRKVELKPLPLTKSLCDNDVTVHFTNMFEDISLSTDRLTILIKQTRDSKINDDEIDVEALHKTTDGILRKMHSAIKDMYYGKSSNKVNPVTTLRECKLPMHEKEIVANYRSKVEDKELEITKIAVRNLIPINKDDLKGERDMDKYRIAIIGKTGVGKSSLGNYMAGDDVFMVQDISGRVTKQFSRTQVDIGGRKLVIYDTVGFYDSKEGNSLPADDLRKACKDEGEGFHAFLYLVNTQAEQDAIRTFRAIKKKHGDGIVSYMILVLNRVQGSVKTSLKESNELNRIHIAAGRRTIGVRCRSWKAVHKTERDATCQTILRLVQHISHAHNNEPYRKGFFKMM